MSVELAVKLFTAVPKKHNCAQAVADGVLKDLKDVRDTVKRSFTPVTYTPGNVDKAALDAAYAKFLSLIGK